MVMNKEVISHVGNNRTQYNPVSNGCLRCPRTVLKSYVRRSLSGLIRVRPVKRSHC